MPGDSLEPVLSPGLVLAILVGAFHTSTYLFIRGRGGWHVLAVLGAACLGALLGQPLGARVGDVLWIGEFGLASSSVGAWAGIGLVILALSVRRARRREAGDAGRIEPRPRRP